MESKTLSKKALDLIEQYLHFQIGDAVVNVPYYNNRTRKNRIALRAYVGKGSPEDIRDELEAIILREKIERKSFSNESLKKILVDNNLGIECSGFVYYVLEAESENRNLGTISKNINFINCRGFVGQIRCAIRPVENCDVETFAHNSNSKIVALKDILPGDIITMQSDKSNKERNHILIVREVKYENSTPKQIVYSHSVAYPEDGLYNTGPRNGTIDIVDANLPITKQNWIEENRQDQDNKLFVRATNSLTEVRRLNFL